ncbi:MAG: hypothetical protein CYPHOPRED_005737 [Cyphobasidiales sp. Tagirdzhanova-0007]|nr:MAG: hypothetical protein CYPHOPRED_005737 [Cyphobasidiales sp. Tagirdzhanova-0007]
MSASPSQLHTLKELRSSINLSKLSNAERRSLKHEAQELFRTLEAPSEFGLRYTWEHPSTVASLQVLSDLELFAKWLAMNKGSPLSGTQLADKWLTSRMKNFFYGTSSGPEALADGQPSRVDVEDRIGGTHTRNVKDAVVREQVDRHSHHEVTPIVDRNREETEIHQKVQPVLDEQRQTTRYEHNAPAVSRQRAEDIDDASATKYQNQLNFGNERNVGDTTHSTSVNAPIVHERVQKNIVEEIQPVIERQTHQTEHHHTTQLINEEVTHAPRVHDVVVEQPIGINEFTKGGSIAGSHGARGATIDEGVGGGRGMGGGVGSGVGGGVGGGGNRAERREEKREERAERRDL